ncbi:MAG TPA: DNA polymerase III subunit gamma/tau, partial [Nocardioidaceae bacterium]|nr:DNA polymerase III subunit gamma/tau [Nocardioidaceae bacterium]
PYAGPPAESPQPGAEVPGTTDPRDAEPRAAEPVRPATSPADAGPVPVPAEQPAATPSSAPGGGLGLVDVRRLWPDLLEAVKLKRRYTWILLSQNAQVAAVDDKTLTIALVNAGARNSFASGGSDEILRQAAIDVIGQDWRIEAIVDPTVQPGADPAGEPRVVRPAVDPEPAAPAPPAPPPAPEAPPREPNRPVDPSAIANARGAIQPTRAAGAVAPKEPTVSDDDAHPDDPDADDHSLGGAQLLERELGARVIEEIKHD